jgi:phage shock protein A
MFQRIVNLFKGFLGLFISGIEKQSPEALLEVEKENLRKQVAKYNQGLASHAGLCERLMTQVQKLEIEERDLKAKTSANLKVGNRTIAAQYALRLQTVSRELGENRSQLEQAEETYKSLLKARDEAVNAAKAKIEGLRRSLDDLKIKRATAELSEVGAGMVTSIGSSGDTLDRLQQMVEEERQVAAGKARVARDALLGADVDMKEAEEAALAEQALADFAAKEGIAMEPASSASPQTESAEQKTKSMGPGTQEKE